MKRPAFQFYPADWRKDVELRSCSVAARGLWMDMLCIAHECEPYGHLIVNGNAMTAVQISGQVGVPLPQCKRLLDELLANGVARQTPEGAIYNKRMVEDERLRNIRAESGRLGGNPNLVRHKVNQIVNHGDKQSPTPSSSSSSSSSKESNALSGKPDVSPMNGFKSKAVEVLDFLNSKTGRRYQALDANVKMIAARLKDGASVGQCKQVIAKKCREWQGDEKMDEYLRPATLFNATKFAQYVGELVIVEDGHGAV